MRRFVWLLLALTGTALLGAACDPFGVASGGDYTVFSNCPPGYGACASGNQNILVMKAPTTTSANGVETLKGELQLRLYGRDQAFHNMKFPNSTITKNSNSPAASSIAVGGSAEGDATFGISGLDLSAVTLSGSQDSVGTWRVQLHANAAYNSPAAKALLPPFIGLANSFSATVSDPSIPLKTGIALSNLDLGGFHFGTINVFNESWPDHSVASAAVNGASGKLGPVDVSNASANVSFTPAFSGNIHVTATASSNGMTIPISVDLPVHPEGGNLVAGPNANISLGTAPNNVSLTGTFQVPLGGVFTGQGNLLIADAVLGWGSTQIPLHAEVAKNANGLSVVLDAAAAQLSPSVKLLDAHMSWAANTLSVQASAALTGTQVSGTASVTGSATLSGGQPSLDLNLAVPTLTYHLPDGPGGAPRSVQVDNAAFHLGGNFSGGTVSLSVGSFSISQGVLGNNAISGDLSVNGQLAIGGSSLAITGWKLDLAPHVRIGLLDTNASIHGSGGSLYDGAVSGPGYLAQVTGVLNIVDPGRGLAGVLNVNVTRDANGVIHLDAIGEAHVTLGSKIVIDGTVTVADNVITVNAQAKVGTSLNVSVSGTITLNPSNPTAIPTVNLAFGRIYLSNQIWLDNVNFTNGSDLQHFALTGKIDNSYAAKALGMTLLSVTSGIPINGSIDLSSGELTSATAGNIAYDLHVTAPNLLQYPRLLSVFLVQKTGLDFHVWGNTHTGNVSLEAQATIGANIGLVVAGADGHASLAGSVNFDTGAVNVTGHIGAMVAGNAFGIIDAAGSAGLDVTLTGNTNTNLTLAAAGSAWAGANFIGIPVASGNASLTANIQADMASGALSGTAHVWWSIDVVGGLFGNHDGDWTYAIAGTVSSPQVTTSNGYWRDNHYRAKDITGQIYPVKSVCGTYQKKGTLEFNWHTIGTWGDCNGNATLEGTMLVDTDLSHTLTPADAPLPSGAYQDASVTFRDTSQSNELVGTAQIDDDGTFGVNVPVRAGHTYSASLNLPSGYKFNTQRWWGYATSSMTFPSPTAAGQHLSLGTYGIKPIQWGSLNGSIYNDLNGNGLRDSGEPGASSVHITVSGLTGGDRTTYTDAAGAYTMNMIDLDDSATVTVDIPAGWSLSADPDGLPDAATNAYFSGGVANVGAFGICQGTCGNGSAQMDFYLYTASGQPSPMGPLELTYQGTSSGANASGILYADVWNGSIFTFNLNDVPAGTYEISGMGATLCQKDPMMWGQATCGQSVTIRIAPRANEHFQFTAWQPAQYGETPVDPTSWPWPW